MSNPFDQFDAQQSGSNPFDRFSPPQQAQQTMGQPQPLTFAERFIAPVLDKLGGAVQSQPGVVGDAARLVLNDGNARGGVVGRLAQGAADPGVAVAQIAANAVGQGKGVNQAITNEEAQYQAARNAAGSTGFDPLRMAGNIAITAPLAGVGAPAESLLGMAGKGALQGAGFGALQPVENAGDTFLSQKLKQVGTGALAGAVTAPAVGALARVVSPNASVNPSLQLLKDEGVQPTVGQTLGGMANSIEEKAQSLPIMGDAIRSARQGAGDQVIDAAYGRSTPPPTGPLTQALDPVTARGNAGISELGDRFNKAYEDVLPKLTVDVTDPAFVQRLSALRSMVQTLPKQEADQFDAVLERELGDQRVTSGGLLSGQNLKDAWNALRDAGQTFSKSPDAYQSQLGQAFKQTFQELKDQVAATNPADTVSALKNTDFAYANFKRLQRASASIGAEGGNPTPAMLQSAVKALDTSKDKARFAGGDALMQDLSSAGKSILSNKVPDSGTAGRMMLGAGGLAAGIIHPGIPAALVGGAAAYTPPVQNFLRMLVSERPDAAPQVANYLKQLALPATSITVPMLQQRFH